MVTSAATGALADFEANFVQASNIRSVGDVQAENLIADYVLGSNIRSVGDVKAENLIADYVLGSNIRSVGDVQANYILGSNIRSVGDVQAQNITASGLLTASNIRVLGDYVILDTITSNTEQMVITNDGTGPALKVTQTGANSIAEFYDDGNALAFKVANDGLVGIGTANPLAKLHVVGSVKATASITSDTQFLGQAIDTASAPSFSFIANPDTGIFQPATSNLAISTGGAERLRVLENGNVGIGTPDPQAKLHVVGSALLNSNLTVSGGDIRTGAAIASTLFDDTTTGSIAIGGALTTGAVTLGSSGSTGAVSMFPATGSQAITLGGATTGLITIGSTTASAVQLPTGKTKVGQTTLVQGGAVSVTLPAIAGTLLAVENALTSGTTDAGFLKYNGTTAAAGQLDGGTTTPTGTTRLNYGGYIYPTAVNLVGTGDTATSATHYLVETGSDGFVRPKTLANVQAELVTTASVNTAAATTVGTITSGVWNAGALTSSGNVSAGAQVLAPSGGLVGAPGFSWTGNTNTGIYRPATNELGIVTNGGERIRVSATGNVGIGTINPKAPLQIGVGDGDKIVFAENLGIAGSKISHLNGWGLGLYTGRSAQNDGGFISFHTSSSTGHTEQVRILSTGNVGIGITNPNANLHVNGTFYAIGCIIQVVQAYSTSQPTSTSTTFISGGITATITPKFASSRIFVFLQTSFQSSSNNTVRGGHKLFRNAVELVYHNDIANINVGTPLSLVYRDAFSYMDSPATTSAVTYSNQFRREIGNGSYGEYVICNADLGYITLMEIAT
jgi:hypothetical protein